MVKWAEISIGLWNASAESLLGLAQRLRASPMLVRQLVVLLGIFAVVVGRVLLRLPPNVAVFTVVGNATLRLLHPGGIVLSLVLSRSPLLGGSRGFMLAGSHCVRLGPGRGAAGEADAAYEGPKDLDEA